MTMIIIGIISAVAIPRFFDTDVFKARGFADEVQATLRYAQKVAIAQHRFVCVRFTNNSITLDIGATATCGTPLISPAGDASYVINAPSGITFGTTAPVVPNNFGFNALGAPIDITTGVLINVRQTINIVGAANGIAIEQETGYVH